ncbi:antibiotic biosynthesis monooxygenase family protein [Mesorhizobium sp. B2-3-4]|uniref:antibiotic biosynthesis monooxygenase family protein n=1 Tax=Mesorhizobium sp. B2-3-4 TaxID=2589959 RepID=UPI001129CDD2|nr:antibiotic biosynthesis monooxygenase family protein [Mesorhizobium sp. B2-3-4]TPM39511.1 antibiotic biosynthesis monooxygenase [Mesorhizobium sp. B2-3-4]
MPIIRADTGVVTQINVFTVPEGGQQALIDLLREAAMSCRGIPGWMSASLHRSLDGTRVANYAQARDQAAMRRVFEHLRTSGLLDRNKGLGQAHPGLYEVALTIE